jgi:hypothetical protein
MKNKSLIYVFILLVFSNYQLSTAQLKAESKSAFVNAFVKAHAELKKQFKQEQRCLEEKRLSELREYKNLEQKYLENRLQSNEHSRLNELYLMVGFSHLAANFAHANHLQRKKNVFESLLYKHREELEPLLMQAKKAIAEKNTDLLPSESFLSINCVLATLADSFANYPKVKINFSPDSDIIIFDESIFAPVNGLTVQEALVNRLALLRDVDSPGNR